MDLFSFNKGVDGWARHRLKIVGQELVAEDVDEELATRLEPRGHPPGQG